MAPTGEEKIEVVDRRKHAFIIVDKAVVWGWLPYIKATGYTLYSVYVSLVNNEQGRAFPSIRTLETFTGMSHTTIRKYNGILEAYGLIKIERLVTEDGSHVVNRYYILDVPPIPEDLGDDLRRRSIVGNIDDHVEIEGGPAFEGGGPVNGPGGGPINGPGGRPAGGTETDKRVKETKTTTPAQEATSPGTSGTSSVKGSLVSVVVQNDDPDPKTEPTPEPAVKSASKDIADTPSVEDSPQAVVVENDDSEPEHPNPEPPQKEGLEDSVEELEETITWVAEELVEIGICNAVARKLTKRYGAARVFEVLGALDAQEKQPENPAGWVRRALTENWDLKAPVRGPGGLQGDRSQAEPTQDKGGSEAPEDPETEAEREELRRYFENYWREFQARRKGYPQDFGDFTAPDTYHPVPPEEECLDPVVGVQRLKAGLEAARRVP